MSFLSSTTLSKKNYQLCRFYHQKRVKDVLIIIKNFVIIHSCHHHDQDHPGQVKPSWLVQADSPESMMADTCNKHILVVISVNIVIIIIIIIHKQSSHHDDDHRMDWMKSKKCWEEARGIVERRFHLKSNTYSPVHLLGSF